MATQTIEFRSPPSQTVTLRLFVVGSDTQVASAVATEATNRKGTYAAAFTDVPALEYSYVATIGTSPIIPVASGYVELTLTTATFQVYDFAKDRDGGGGGATAEEIAEEVWGFDLATAAANTAGAALAAVATSFNKLFRWLGVLAGKGSDPATLAEIQATDGGATFDNATDSLEALGDAVGAAQIGDWAITRTFQISGGAKVSGVRMSLVGVAGKTDTTGTDGVATIKADDGTFTLRVVVPAGYEDVADTTVTINGADSTATVTLIATTTPAAPSPDACILSVYVRNQATEPFPGVTVTGRFPRGWSVADGAMNLNEVVTDTTDANGLAQLVLVRDQDYDLSFSRANGTIAKIRITTPDAATSTLIQSYQG